MSGLPERPLLELGELPDPLVDYREQVPYLEPYLGAHDRVVQIDTFPPAAIPPRLSAVKETLRLCGVEKTNDIGTNGPCVAALPFEDNYGEAELRKFEHLFGRDSLIEAIFLKDLHPQLLESTVLRLAELQGVADDPQSGEQPGGILHDNMDPNDPVARKFAILQGWKFPFYATVDATPLFISAISNCVQNNPVFLEREYTDKRGQSKTVRQALEAAVGWLERRLDDNPEGLLEYRRTGAKGLDNQAWKDSYHAYVHADGTFANHDAGIASVEVQAYAYDALLDAGGLYEKSGEYKHATSVRERAHNLRRRILTDFWVDEDGSEGFFALGTDRDADGNLRRLAVRTSNMGYLLNSKVLDGDDTEVVRKREATVRNLFRSDLLAAGGLRTLANSEKAFSPYSYHNGGVWPHDTALVANGLERHGYLGLAWNLRERIWRGVEKCKKFYELSRGGDEAEVELSDKSIYAYNPEVDLIYLAERVPQEIQGWVVAAILQAKHKWPLPPGFHRKLPSTPLVSQEEAKRQLEQSLLTS